MLSVSARSPEPPAVFPVASPVATLVKDTLVRLAENVSATDTAGSSLGPLLVTTIVYVIVS